MYYSDVLFFIEELITKNSIDNFSALLFFYKPLGVCLIHTRTIVDPVMGWFTRFSTGPIPSFELPSLGFIS